LKRLEPPADVQGIDRDIFKATVASLPASHFLPEDTEMLRAYCAAAAMARRAAAEMQASPLAGDKPSPWLKVHTTAIRSMAQMSVRLRLGARSRDHNVRSAKPVSPPSYYEIMEQKRGQQRSVETPAEPLVGVDKRWT
jgi:phage terminase small subunit